MPRRKTGSPPSYRLHKPSDQAVVTIDGQDLYLGKFGSPESHEKYERLIKAWRDRRQPAAGPAPLPPLSASPPTVNELILAYVRHAAAYYQADTAGEQKEVGCIKDALRIVRALSGPLPATEFGPKALKAVRVEMVRKGWARTYTNHQVNRIKRMFRWATEEELIPATVYHALQAVKGLRKGLPGVRETKKIRPVATGAIKKVLKQVGPVVRAMILFQFHTGCRPSEVCRLKPKRIDRGGEVWVYRPGRHKTAHHGKRRRILIGPRAQKVLAPWLEGVGPDDFVFTPRKSEMLRQTARRVARKTPLWPSHLARLAKKRKAQPKRSKRERYDTPSYRRAIERACDKAFPLPQRLARRRQENGKPESQAAWWARLTAEERDEVRVWRREHRWRPNQLRHTAATRIRKRHGIEMARIILGHSTAFTTEIYAEADQKKATVIMGKMG
jgi:integrase